MQICSISSIPALSQETNNHLSLYFVGNVTIPGGMTLSINSDLNGDRPQFTLTCISTGGPATTVTWTRDSQTVSGGVTVLVNPVTAQYTHTLTVTGRLVGQYQCTVANSKPSQASAQFTVQGDLYNNEKYMQEGFKYNYFKSILQNSNFDLVWLGL